MGEIITEEDLKRCEMQQKQQQQMNEWAAAALKAQELMRQVLSTNPPSSSWIPESNEKLSLQIRIIGEQSSGIRLLKKEFLIELPYSEVRLDSEAPATHIRNSGPNGETLLCVYIPLKSQPQPSDLPETVTPLQHESKVLG